MASTYEQIYIAANDAAFQGRCMVAMWHAANDIVNDTGKLKGHGDWANRVLQDKATVTPRQLAMQVLRNASIAANPVVASDDDIQFQVNSILPSLIALG